MTYPVPFCKDCRFFKESATFVRPPWCALYSTEVVTVSVVYGPHTSQRAVSCSDARDDTGECGFRGRGFQPKEPSCPQL